jgi:hypothetical protein
LVVMKFTPTVRLATQADVPAIISLLLTSFRSFPLFDFLYSPLRTDKNNAFDTVFFWSRRVKLAISNPLSAVVVAELPASSVNEHVQNGDRPKTGEPWLMLDWVQTRARLQQRAKTTGMFIVGFAIWQWRNVSNFRPSYSYQSRTIQAVKSLY